MKGPSSITRRRLAGGLLVAGTLTCFASVGAVIAAPPPSTVQWQLPLAVRQPAQTPAQKARAKREGRQLPQPEVLQPTLDPRLPIFQPAFSASLHGTIRIESSDILPELVRLWGHAFSRFYPDVHIEFGPPFEGSHAADELIAGHVDIALVSRELKPSDVRRFTARYGYAPTSVPVSGGSYRHFGFLDAVAVVVNPGNPIQRLSKKQLDAVFSASHLRSDKPVTRWGQLGAEGAWKDRPIHVYAIKPWNGFEEFFRQRILDANGHRGHWRSGIHLAPTVFPIAGEVAADPDGIGYTGVAFMDAPVKVLAIGRGARAFSPTYTKVALAQYPLSRLIYANVNLKPGHKLGSAMREFLRFILTRQGQEAILDEGIFLPLRGFQADRARALANLSNKGMVP